MMLTLDDIEKLSRQFRKDILTDNIKKGDIGFHRALTTQVCFM